MDVRYDVPAIHQDAGFFRRPQRDVQRRAVFGEVDFVAAKHGVDAFPQPGFGCQLEEQLQRFVGDAVFRIIQIESGGLQGHSFAAFWICGEEITKVQIAGLLEVRGQGAPGFAPGESLNLKSRRGHEVLLS